MQCYALLNITVLYCRILLLICLFVVVLPGAGLALNVEVKVNGLDDELKKNVLSRLELNLHRNNPHLSDYDVRRLHRQAESDIRGALAPFGYYSPEIKSDLSKDGENYLAEYAVDSGKPVRVSAVQLRIDGAGAEVLQKGNTSFPLAVGDILDQRKYEEGKKKLIRTALRKGYMRAAFAQKELQIDRTAREASIYLKLDTGPQFVFGKTSFDSQYVSNKLLEEYLPYAPGDPYSPAQLLKLQRGLYQTEFFKSVVVDGKVDSADGLSVPVQVTLTMPENLNRYSVGLGYATDTGARARFEWRNRLINRKGHKINGSAQISEMENSLGISYEVPWANPLTDSFSYNSSYYDKIWEDTESRLVTVGVQAERRKGIVTHSGALELRAEDYDVGVTSGSSTLFIPSYTGSVVWADNLLDTDYGLKLSLNISGASESFGSDATFLKAVVDGKTILSLLPGWRLIARGSLGATLVDSINDIPPSLRFYTGGDQSVRGYGYREIGTKDSSGAVVGGRYLVVGSLELERELTESISAAVFWDVGNAVDDLSLAFKQGAGVGLRYRLPFGQVRVDVASAILEDEMPVRLHLSVGADL